MQIVPKKCVVILRTQSVCTNPYVNVLDRSSSKNYSYNIASDNEVMIMKNILATFEAASDKYHGLPSMVGRSRKQFDSSRIEFGRKYILGVAGVYHKQAEKF
ncbi:unnamed protein product [Trifolium pratense]|uniref:Uncharacterized protein n=1 Tax=Trifolium pratense TaxID=57577 RepID=A0ACB0J7W8_TRIPR|nr:unnamed protein product [Trifolium pratense]